MYRLGSLDLVTGSHLKIVMVPQKASSVCLNTESLCYSGEDNVVIC